MSKFNKWTFINIINELEKKEKQDENIWLTVGVLEFMYDDDDGWIDSYFHTDFNDRDVFNLCEKLNLTK